MEYPKELNLYSRDGRQYTNEGQNILSIQEKKIGLDLYFYPDSYNLIHLQIIYEILFI